MTGGMPAASLEPLAADPGDRAPAARGQRGVASPFLMSPVTRRMMPCV